MTTPLPERVAREIRAELARQQMTQATLAAAMGKNEMYVSRRLGVQKDGRLPLDMTDLERIAEVLKVPASHFLGDPSTAPARAS
jgi:transcriptional regulator with XRE-family HTH domain